MENEMIGAVVKIIELKPFEIIVNVKDETTQEFSEEKLIIECPNGVPEYLKDTIKSNEEYMIMEDDNELCFMDNEEWLFAFMEA